MGGQGEQQKASRGVENVEQTPTTGGQQHSHVQARVLATGPNAEALADLIQTFPQQAAQIMATIATHFGNSAVLQTQAAQKKAGVGTGRVTASQLNVRSAPVKADDNVIAQLDHGTPVEPIAKQGPWLQIPHGQQSGYVWGQWVELPGSASSPDPVAHSETQTPAQAADRPTQVAPASASSGSEPTAHTDTAAPTTQPTTPQTGVMATTTTEAPQGQAPQGQGTTPQQPAPQVAAGAVATSPTVPEAPHRLGPDVPVTATTLPEETSSARNATLEQIHEASDSDKGKEALDIKWIDDLPAHMRNEIDTDFYSDEVSHKVVAQGTRTGLQTFDKDQAKDEKALHDEIAKKLAGSDDKKKIAAVSKKDIEKDPDYVTKHAKLVSDYDKMKADYLADETRKHDASAPVHHPSKGENYQSVSRPKTATITRQEGQVIARSNFMSWAVQIFHTAERVKHHFLGEKSGDKKDGKFVGGVRLVSGQPGMWLADSAATRFETARADFEAKHPGYTFPDTDVAQDMRGMHQQRWGVGMLGHAIGEAFDFLAIDNPNIKIDDNGHSYAYLVGKFGGKDNKRGTGRSTMQVSESSIEQTGIDVNSGKAATPQQDAMINKLKDQFAEMSATSETLKRTKAAQMPKLDAARDLYFSEGELKAKAADANSRLKQADTIASRQVKDEKITDPDAIKARTAEVKKQLAQDAADATKAMSDVRNKVTEVLNDVFADWVASIQADMDRDSAIKTTDDVVRAATSKEEADLTAIDSAEEGAKDKLNDFAKANKLTEFDKQKKWNQKDAKTFKAALIAELKSRGKKVESEMASHEGDGIKDLTELKWYQSKLTDPAFVFGKGVAVEWSDKDHQHATHWKSKYDASQIPLMQVLEHGTVRDDAMPESPAGGGKKKIYNGEVIATLARFGWSPGAAFGDTMHFDFIEGYNKAVPGGRSGENMKPTRYSPEGAMHDTDPAKK